jgi:glycosyltransferase involved in cell wall biosynthesis
MSTAPVRLMLLVNTLGFGGAEKHIVTLANGLDTERFRCSVVYLKPDEALLPQLDRSRLDAVISLNIQRRLDFAAIGALAAKIDELGTDAILCATEYPTLLAWLATRKSRRKPKLIEVFHTTVFGTFKERLAMSLFGRIFRRFDLLVYVSSKQQDYWQARGLRARQNVMIHNGVDPEYFRDAYSAQQKSALRGRYGFGSDDFVVGICAALRPEKAHGDLLQALVRLQRAGSNARCLIIGDGPERAHIEQTIAALELQQSVAITGYQTDVRPLVACCDVMVLPSHAVETFSIATLEAMALGKPVVLSRIGGAEELVIHGECGLLFEAGRVDQLTAHMQTLAVPGTRQRMGAAAAERVRASFTESGMLQRYAEQLSSTALGESRRWRRTAQQD